MNQYTPTAKGHDPVEYSSIYGGSGVGTAATTIVGIITAGVLNQTIADLDQFTANNGLATVKTETYNSNGKSSSDYGEGEWDEDSQGIVGMAGGEVGRIVFYNSPDLTDADLAANFNRVVSVNTAKIISASIGFCETDEKNSGATTADDQIFAVAVAQGQTFAFANGDYGSDECGNGGTTPLYPAASPYVVAVAGTTLTATATTWSNEIRRERAGDQGLGLRWQLSHRSNPRRPGRRPCCPPAPRVAWRMSRSMPIRILPST